MHVMIIVRAATGNGYGPGNIRTATGWKWRDERGVAEGVFRIVINAILPIAGHTLPLPRRIAVIRTFIIKLFYASDRRKLISTVF
jgi:small basic protein